MKKEFIKKLSFAMASAIVVTSATPMSNVEAASKMKMTKSSKVLYLNGDNMTDTKNTIDLNIKNKPANYKKTYSFNWYAEDTSIVSVAKSGIVKAKKVGQTTVKCDITKKSTKKLVTTAKCVVTVKANAETVVINNAPEDNKMTVGSTFDFNRTMKDENGKKATDKTEWVVSDPEVASVDKNGVVTALKAGTFTIKACTYQSKATKDLGYTAESEEVTITVAPSISKFTQTSSTDFDVEFDSDMSKLTASDFNVTNAAGVKQIIKEVKFDATGKKATVKLYLKMTDKTDYTVKVKDMEAKTFTASVGEAASIVVTTTKVSDNVNNESVHFKVLDANGIVLYDGDSVNPGISSNDSVQFEVTDGSKGYFDGNKLIGYKIGDVVPVKITYNNGKINTTTGEVEKVVSEVTGVTVVDNAGSTINSVVATTVSDVKLGKNADWSNASNSVSVSDVSGNKVKIPVKYLHVKALNSSNETVYTDANAADKDNWKFTSADTTTLNIDAETGELIPVSVGTANVICKNGDFSYVTTVTVGAARTAASVALNMTSVRVSNKVDNPQTFEMKIKDNYGKEMGLKDASFEATQWPTNSDKVAAEAMITKKAIVDCPDKAEFTVKAKDAVKGTYRYKFTATEALNSATRYYTVEVTVGEAGSVSYAKVVSPATKDVTINPWNNETGLLADSFDIKVADVDNTGLESAYRTDATYTITNPDGAVVYKSGASKNDVHFTAQTDGSIKVNPFQTVTGGSISKMKAGTYRITATYTDNGRQKNATAGQFLIQDNQKKATVELKKKTLTINAGENLIQSLIDNEVIKSDQGKISTISELNISSTAGYNATTGNVANTGTFGVTLKKIVVNYEIKNNDDVLVIVTPQEITETYTVDVTVK